MSAQSRKRRSAALRNSEADESEGSPTGPTSASTTKSKKKKSLEVPKPDTESLKEKLKNKPLPRRSDDGDLKFDDHQEFVPNLTPKEVLQAGSFGGTYYRDLYSSVLGEHCKDTWKELPEDWLKGLDIETEVASQKYRESKNKYNAKCGGSLQMWEESGWIKKQDPYGWFQWYCRFYQGRRTKDDERQISRWAKCAGERGRWRNNLITKIYKAKAKYDDKSVSPVVRQVLLHWAYELTESHYKEGAKVVAKRQK